MIRYRIYGWTTRAIGVVLLALLVNALVVGREDSTQIPGINVVFLDDGSIECSQGIRIRRNNWDEWQKRLPTFLRRLRTVGHFSPCVGGGTDTFASLYAIEISPNLSPTETDEVITLELEGISNSTRRPSVVLARSSVGTDQLRVVFQDWDDYTPTNAAKLLRVFREISPPIAHSRLANSFGPFTAPPTLVFDPRVPFDRVDKSENDRPRQRWGILEETYLLPHYVLHLVAVLNEAVKEFGNTYYATSVPEHGTLTVVLAPSDILDTACAAVAGSRGSGAFFPRVMASDFLRNENVRPGSTIACPTPTMITQSFAPERTQFHRVISRLEQQGVDYRVIAGNDIGARTAIQTLNRIPGARDTKLTLAEPFTGLLGTSARDLDRIGIRNLDVSVLVTRTSAKASDIRGLRTLVPSLYECRTDRASMGISGGVGPFSAGLSVLTSPSLWQHPDKVRSVRAYLPGREWSASLSPPSLLGVSKRPMTSLPDTGGILFNKGNVYWLDLRGTVSLLGDKAVTALAASDDISGRFRADGQMRLSVGIPVQRRRAKARPRQQDGDLMICQLDIPGKVGSFLPQRLMRFRSLNDLEMSGVMGDWTFEPLTMGSRYIANNAQAFLGKQEVTVVPHETGSRLCYVVEYSNSNGASTPQATACYPKGGSFQPDLVVNNAEGYSWLLRHGVAIDFDQKGLVSSIRNRDGEQVAYHRSGNRIIRKVASSGWSAMISYEGERPTRAAAEQADSIEYLLDSGCLASVRKADGDCRYTYDHTNRLSSLRKGNSVLKLKRDLGSCLKEIAAPGLNVACENISGRNALRICITGGETVEWRFRPGGGVAGVTRGDTAVLWTKSSDGRIIQLAVGRTVPGPEGHEFVPFVVIGTSPQDVT
jgi:hypothetical protein